jgi:hypothetical protein
MIPAPALAAPLVALVLIAAGPARRPAPPPPAPPVIARIDAPGERQVVQRGEDDAALVAVRGRVDGPAARVLARARLRDGGRGRAVPWRVLDDATGPDGAFAGALRLEAGGWYAIELRAVAVAAGRAGPVATVGRVGVGEVFVVAGQSNACNFGRLDPLAPAPDDRVSAFGDDRWAVADPAWPYQRGGGTGRDWAPAASPLPFTYGVGGHPWVVMANRLVEALDVPVGLCPVAYPGSAIASWQPGGPPVPGLPGSRPFPHLVAALGALRDRGGLRAVLWHQGENDRPTPPDEYAAMLTNLIARSREAVGMEVPWVIARVAYGMGSRPIPAGSDPCDPGDGPPTIRLAQCEVAATVPGCFPGPTTDDLGPSYRVGLHFNARGLQVHGDRWADVLLGPPGLLPLPPAPAPPPRPRPGRSAGGR